MSHPGAVFLLQATAVGLAVAALLAHRAQGLLTLLVLLGVAAGSLALLRALGYLKLHPGAPLTPRPAALDPANPRPNA